MEETFESIETAVLIAGLAFMVIGITGLFSGRIGGVKALRIVGNVLLVATLVLIVFYFTDVVNLFGLIVGIVMIMVLGGITNGSPPEPAPLADKQNDDDDDDPISGEFNPSSIWYNYNSDEDEEDDNWRWNDH
jgi:hypothetical protein